MQTRPTGSTFRAQYLLGGALVLLVVFVAVGTLPAWHNARQSERAQLRGSTVPASSLRRATSPKLSNGVRFGLEPGRRGTTACRPRPRSSGRSRRSASRLRRSVPRRVWTGSCTMAGSTARTSISPSISRVTSRPMLRSSTPSWRRSLPMPPSSAASEMRSPRSRSTVSRRPRSPSGRVAMPADHPDDRSRPGPRCCRRGSGLTTMHQLGVGISDTVEGHDRRNAGTARRRSGSAPRSRALRRVRDRLDRHGALLAPEALGPRRVPRRASYSSAWCRGVGAFESRCRSARGLRGRSVSVRWAFRPTSKVSQAEVVARRTASLLVPRRGLRPLRMPWSSQFGDDDEEHHGTAVGSVPVRRAMRTARSGRGRASRSAQAGLLFGVPLGIVAGRWSSTLLANGFGAWPSRRIIPV